MSETNAEGLPWEAPERWTEILFVASDELFFSMQSNNRTNLLGRLNRDLNRIALLFIAVGFTLTIAPLSADARLRDRFLVLESVRPWSVPAKIIIGRNTRMARVNFHPARKAITSEQVTVLIALASSPIRCPDRL